MSSRIRRTAKNVENTRDYLGIRDGAKVVVTQIPVAEAKDAVFWGESDIGHEVDDVKVGETYTVGEVFDDGSILLREPDAIFPWFCVKPVASACIPPKYNTRDNTPFYEGRKVWVNDKPAVITGAVFMGNTIRVNVTYDGGDSGFAVDYSEVRLYPKTNKTEVVLNSDYTAVYKEGENSVTVGCQTIPVEKVLELADAIRKSKAP